MQCSLPYKTTLIDLSRNEVEATNDEDRLIINSGWKIMWYICDLARFIEAVASNVDDQSLKDRIIIMKPA